MRRTQFGRPPTFTASGSDLWWRRTIQVLDISRCNTWRKYWKVDVLDSNPGIMNDSQITRIFINHLKWIVRLLTSFFIRIFDVKTMEWKSLYRLGNTKPLIWTHLRPLSKNNMASCHVLGSGCHDLIVSQLSRPDCWFDYHCEVIPNSIVSCRIFMEPMHAGRVETLNIYQNMDCVPGKGGLKSVLTPAKKSNSLLFKK